MTLSRTLSVVSEVVLILLFARLSVAQKHRPLDDCPDVALPFYEDRADPDDPTLEIYREDPIYSVNGYLASFANAHVLRWPGPSPIIIRYASPDISKHSLMNGCIKQADVDQRVADAFAAWTGICDPGTFDVEHLPSIPPGQDGITFVWDTRNFPAGIDPAGRVSPAGAATDWGKIDDNLIIKNPVIRLNNSDQFNNQFVFTTCPQTCTIVEPQLAVSLCQVILHEIGHAFGLLDIPNYPGSTMEGDIWAGKNACLTGGLQDVDVCYFCKLYCPENCVTLGAPLDITDTNSSVSVFPNPARDMLNVTYKAPVPHSKIVIEDIQGRRIFNLDVEGTEGEVHIPRAKMPSGAYLVRLVTPVGFRVRLLLLE